MTELQFSQIAFMPYAPISEGFTVGDYEIWPYYMESEMRIGDENTLRHFNRYFSRYVEWKWDRVKGGFDSPLQEIFLITPKSFSIGQDRFSTKQIEDIGSISHIVAFTAICELSFGSGSTDAYTLFFQNFKTGADGIGVGRTYYSKLEMVKFMKPYDVDRGLVRYKCTDLCKALGNALAYRDNPTIKRILRALELFYYTATNNERVTAEHRLLSLVMCFEVLLNFNGKKEFVEKIESLLENYNPKIETRVLKIKNKDENISKPLTSWWAYDIYNLRSAIVHGDDIDWEIEKYGGIWTRIRFAGILLRKLIKKLLSKELLWTFTYTESLIEAERLDETLESMVTEFKSMI